jgi:hypothetical protein
MRGRFARHWSRLAQRAIVRGLPIRFEPILVYQMAKVGSSAIVDSIEASGRAVFHVHRMRAEHLAELRETRRQLGWTVPPIPPHDTLGLRLNEVVFERRRPKVITLVREPIGRNLSAYFEHLDFIWQTPDAHAKLSSAELHRGFLERYTHNEPLTWFDDELRPVCGIDVYERPFPESGHLTITGERCDLLVLKSEVDNEAKRQVVAAFLGHDVPRLMPVNRTTDKSKGAAYAQFVRSIVLPDAYVDGMLNSRYCRQWYTAGERAGLRRRYLERAAPAGDGERQR